MRESKYFADILTHILDDIIIGAEKYHAVLDADLCWGAEIGNRMDRIKVHNDWVVELGVVVEVYEKLHWLDVATKVADIDVADLSNLTIKAVIEEALDKDVMRHTDLLWHN